MLSHGVDWYHHLPAHVKGILETLRVAGFEAYLVGGSVRDLWLGLKPKDFDLVSSATPEEIEKLFPRTEGIGRQFGIMIVITDQGPVEVARFRADAEYKDGRHPTAITFSSPEEDAKRRDFTINGLFYDPLKSQVIDFVGGIADLEAKVIRCVGDPEIRFQEDALRILRAARFHSQLAESGFHLAPDLCDAVRRQSKQLLLISRERVTQEVEKILLSSRPSVGLFDLVLLGIWQPVFSSPPPNASLFSNFDALSETYKNLSSLDPPLPLFIGAAARWFPDWKPQEGFVLTREAKAALKEIPTLCKSLLEYLFLDKAARKILLNETFIYEAIAIMRVGESDEVLNILDLAEAEREQWSEAGQLNPAPFISGADLLAAGIAAGPKIRQVLNEIRCAQLRDEITSREMALAWLKKEK